ncbi:MAG: hypothetical protein ACXU9C_09185, partial [Xanthobacteraceae bacterium]
MQGKQPDLRTVAVCDDKLMPSSDWRHRLGDSVQQITSLHLCLKRLPAVGYSAAQLAALQTTINDAQVDAVVSATPADLARLLNLNKQVVRARYEFAEVDEPRLSSIVDAFVEGTL